MAIHTLTAREVAAKSKPGLYGDGGGLYLKVTDGGASWVYRYWTDGRRHALGLGPTHLVSLAEARDKARDLGRSRLAGIDPAAEKKRKAIERRVETAKAMSFKECAEAYVRAHEAGWRSAKHGRQWWTTLETYALPVFGDLPVAAVDVGLVMKALEPLWREKPETGSRVRGRIEAVLDWATARKYRQGENPARWKGHLESLLPAVSKAKRAVRQAKGHAEHFAALPYAETAAFMVELRQQESTYARALEFAILCAARSGELFGATWREVDFQGRAWRIPGERMKAGRDHVVPLSDAALAILEALPKGGPDDKVFPVRNTSTGFQEVLRRMRRGDLTAHGFRSTFSDWCSEQTNFPAEVREMALAHAVGNKVEAAYRRGDMFEKRRQLAEAWARYCAWPASMGDNLLSFAPPVR